MNLNVLYIVNSTTPFGGATKSFLALLRYAVDNGVTPVVLLPDADGVYHLLKQMGIQTIVLKYSPDIYPKSRTLWQKALFLPLIAVRRIRHRNTVGKLLSFVRENKIDIIHSNTSVVSVGYDVAMRLGIPHVYHIREYADKDFDMKYFPSSKAFHASLHNPMSYTICITTDVQRHHGLTGDCNSRVIYNGISETDTTPVFNRAGDYFLYAGRVEPCKGIKELVTAYKAYCEDTAVPLPLLIAGEVFSNGLRDDLESLLLSCDKARDNVKFLGPRKDVQALMRNARAIIIPSLYEAFGRCMPEAMLCGCLAIAHDTAGTKEQLDNGLKMHGENIALRYDTVQQLAEHLQNVSERPVDYYLDMKRRAYMTVKQMYDTQSYADSILSFYEQIMKDKHRN